MTRARTTGTDATARTTAAKNTAAKNTAAKNTAAAAPTTHLVRSHDVTLHAVTQGRPDGPVVVLVHGYPDDHSIWDDVAAALATTCRVIRYDVRGAGRSEAPRQRVRGYRMERLQADLISVIDALAPDERVHLVGHDWGSIQLWASVTAPRLQHRFASFTSLSGPSLDHVGHQSRAAFTSGDARQVRAGLRQTLASWYVMAFQLPLLPELIVSGSSGAAVERRIEQAEGLPAGALASPHRERNARNGIGLYRANMLPRMARPRPQRTAVPVHLVVAERDAYVSPWMAEACLPWVDELTVTRVDGGHWIYRAQPQLLVEAVLATVSRADA